MWLFFFALQPKPKVKQFSLLFDTVQDISTLLHLFSESVASLKSRLYKKWPWITSLPKEEPIAYHRHTLFPSHQSSRSLESIHPGYHQWMLNLGVKFYKKQIIYMATKCLPHRLFFSCKGKTSNYPMEEPDYTLTRYQNYITNVR